MVSMYLISPPLTIYMATIVPAVIGVGSLLGRFLRSQSQAAQAQVWNKIVKTWPLSHSCVKFKF